MKPFDLEAAKRGEPICMESGEMIRFVFFDGVSQKIIYEFQNVIHSLHIEFARSSFFMAPKKRTVWVNLYDTKGHCYMYDSQEKADKRCMNFDDRIGGKAYPVEIEE